MDLGGMVLAVARAYSILLLTVAAGTVVWLLLPGDAASVQVAGIWFALGGFGLLVALTVVLVQLSR